MATLTYSVTEPALRSPVEEWQPHSKQSEPTTEWFYLTALVNDAAGSPYFLAWCPFHFAGEKSSPASAGLASDRRAIAAMAGFTDYRNNFRIADFPAGVVNEADTWNPKTNALRFAAGDYSSEWSYKSDTMNLTVDSTQLSYDLRSTGAEKVMYAKDKLGITGFIQKGAREDRSYYYSLARVEIVGRITYIGKDGVRREIDVTGQGWVDRQWGDFLTKSWEWSSLRFSSGARVNLFNFANGHQLATYQKADGSPNGWTPFSSDRTDTSEHLSEVYGCHGGGAMSSLSRLRAVAITVWSRLASSTSSRTRTTSSLKVLRASSMTTQERRLAYRLLRRLTFAS